MNTPRGIVIGVALAVVCFWIPLTVIIAAHR